MLIIILLWLLGLVVAAVPFAFGPNPDRDQWLSILYLFMVVAGFVLATSAFLERWWQLKSQHSRNLFGTIWHKSGPHPY